MILGTHPHYALASKLRLGSLNVADIRQLKALSVLFNGGKMAGGIIVVVTYAGGLEPVGLLGSSDNRRWP